MNTTTKMGVEADTIGPGLEKAPTGIRGRPAGMLAGSARLAQEAVESEADRVSTASRRWADATPAPDVAPGRRWAREVPDSGGKQ